MGMGLSLVNCSRNEERKDAWPVWNSYPGSVERDPASKAHVLAGHFAQPNSPANLRLFPMGDVTKEIAFTLYGRYFLDEGKTQDLMPIWKRLVWGMGGEWVLISQQTFGDNDKVYSMAKASEHARLIRCISKCCIYIKVTTSSTTSAL